MTSPYLKGALALALFSSLSISSSFAKTVSTEENNDEIVFTANRTPTLQSEVGTQSIVITDNEIQTRQYNTAVEALAHQPGVILSQNSPIGPSSLYLRGSTNTLLLINGVPVFDPMGTNSNFNYAMLGALLDVNRIEVLKVPQSSLYGSHAMGGVVHIFTNDLNKPGTKFRLMVGSHETFQVSATTTGRIGNLRYSLAGLFENTRGIDATLDSKGKPAKDYDKDRNKNRQLSGHLNYLLNENLDIDYSATYNNRYSEYDNLYSTFIANPYHDYNKDKLFTQRLAFNGNFLEDRWSSTFAFTYMNLKRNNYSSDNIGWGVVTGSSFAEYPYRGKTKGINFDNELSFYDNFKTRFGLAYLDEKGSGTDHVNHSQHTKSVYIDQSLDLAGHFFNTFGVRYDDNSSFGSKTTFRLTSRYNITEKVALKGSFGTGFKTPTLYQIYINGNMNNGLKAETSRGYDLGIEFKPTSSSMIGLNYFHTTYKNMIDYYSYPNAYQAPWGEYRNLDRAKIKGIELVGSVELNDQWALSGSYTYLDAKEKKADGEYTKMLRRPKHQITANVTYQPLQNLKLNISVVYYSKRDDLAYNNVTFKNDKVKLDSFALFDLAGSYKINRTFEVDAKIQNLFDKDYEFARGYREKGRTAYVGLNISL